MTQLCLQMSSQTHASPRLGIYNVSKIQDTDFFLRWQHCVFWWCIALTLCTYISAFRVRFWNKSVVILKRNMRWWFKFMLHVRIVGFELSYPLSIQVFRGIVQECIGKKKKRAEKIFRFNIYPVCPIRNKCLYIFSIV